jgi:phage gpG-like protein
MLSVSFDADALERRFAQMPQALRSALREKVEALAGAVRDHIVNDKLSGQVLQVRSGALRASIDYEMAADGGPSAMVGSFGDLPYAAIQEFGGTTSPHDIAPVKAQALAFLLHGKTVFARRVHHPGSVLPERSYLRSAMADMKDEIAQGLLDVVLQELRRR